MNKYVKGIIGTLIIAIPAVLLLGFLLKQLSTKSFYSNSGTLTVSGIKSETKIYSDDYGVPHILASNDEDMYFALGFMHAQDRLWQMDLTRRVAEGKLSEIFGSSTLEFDKLFRTIGINRFAYRWYNNISPESKKILTSYSNGVNSFIDKHYNNLPVEFDVLKYRPEPWKAEQSLMVTRMMAWDLNLAWYTDYIFGELVNKVGLEKVNEIFPDTSISLFKKVEVKDTTETDSTKEISLVRINDITALGNGFFKSYSDYRDFFNINCTHAGSNSWVVSGSKSETGKPLLANDPHLAFMAPSKWYEVHLKSNIVDVTGMSIPGVPGIAMGHNKAISWGLTNLMADDNDFFLLERESDNLNSYKYKNQTYILDSLREKILVKDSNEVDIIVKNTILGPVVSDLESRGFISQTGSNMYKGKLLTFKWTGFEYSDELDAFYKINTAKNWDEFKAGLKLFCTPAMNFMYADTAGNIGYKAAGYIPIRNTENKNDYIYPSSADMEWSGFVDFNELPETFNPKEGYLVTANTNPFNWLKTESNSRYYISYMWEPSSRFDKISEVLNTGFKFNVNEFKLLQTSYQSPYGKEISGYVISAFKDIKNLEPEVNIALNKLKDFNGEMPAADASGAIYNVFFVELLKNIYMDELGEVIFHDFLMIPNLPFRSTLLMLKNYTTENPLWLDNITTPQKETRDEIIRKSFIDALKMLESNFASSDINTWLWGGLHKVTFRHPLGIVPELAKSFNIGPYDVGGDQTAVNNSEYSFNNAIRKGAFENILGPSMRMIVDLSNINSTYTINSTGQSGQPSHPNYSDQTRLWLYGDLKTTVMDEYEMIDKKYNLLTLIPGN